jgi:hypothetical protein
MPNFMPFLPKDYQALADLKKRDVVREARLAELERLLRGIEELVEPKPGDAPGAEQVKRAVREKMAKNARDGKAEKLKNDPVYVLARKIYGTETANGSKVSDGKLIGEIENAMKQAQLKGRDPKTYRRWVGRFREESARRTS